MDLLAAGACVLWPWPLGVRSRDLRGGERDRGLGRFNERHAVFIRKVFISLPSLGVSGQKTYPLTVCAL